jgi:outer membrane receptor protein involved in Fe transport
MAKPSIQFLLISTAPLALAAGMAQAQTAAPPSASPAPPASAPAAAPAELASVLNEIVVTGTSRSRSQLKTPSAVSSVDQVSIQRLTASGQADILNTLPAIKAEGGGGEVAANVFVKGLPSNGQYQFTPLEYDGIPVFTTFGLNSSAYDVYYRNDLGLERLEYVQGGVSNLFGPGSVAGIINFLSTTGSDTQKGQVQAEFSDQDRVRLDAAVSGPVPYAKNLYYAFSGYYRYDNGPLNTGDIARGFQIRGNLKKTFEDGSGSAVLYVQYIDDSTPYYSPLPLDGPSHKELTGNNGSIIQTVDTSAVNGLSYNTPEGVFHTKIGDGVVANGGSVALVVDKLFGDGWGVNVKAKTSHYDTEFNYFLGGDGKFNSPETQSQFLADRGLPTTAVFTDVSTGQALASNAVLFANRFQDRYRNASDSSLEANLKKTLSTGDISHTVTLGTFFSTSRAADIDVITSFLGQFNNNPQLVGLTVTKPGGGQQIVSLNGLLGESGYTNNYASDTREAVYLADQMEFGKFVLDIGVRDESLQGTVDHELTSTQTTNTNPLLAPALQSVVWGNGLHQHGTVGTAQFAFAGGLLYRATSDVSLYVNGARGYFFPQLNSVTFSSAGKIQSYAGEIIYQTQGGVKFSHGIVSGSLSGFYTELDNLENVLFVNDSSGNLVQLTQLVSTKAYGLEAEYNIRLPADFRLNGNVTLQNPTYTSYQSEPYVVGNQLLRQPKVLFNAGLYYNHGPLDAAIYTNYTGTDYTSETNAVGLAPYYLTSLDIGVKPIESTRVSLHIFNLFDSQGVSEGNPRQLNQTAATPYFVGRPVLPRRISVRASYKF